MLKQFILASAFGLCFAASATGQPNTQATPSQTNLPAVDSMTCDQMRAEITSDGQIMSHQLDPQFGVDAQAQYNEAMRREQEAQAQAPANALACLIPFACAAAQQHQQQQDAAEAQRNQALAQTQMNRLNASMSGLDQSRMQALTDRYQAQHCPTPQQPPQH